MGKYDEYKHFVSLYFMSCVFCESKLVFSTFALAFFFASDNDVIDVVISENVNILLYSTEYISVYKKRQARSMYTKSDRNYVTQPCSFDRSVIVLVLCFDYTLLLFVLL